MATTLNIAALSRRTGIAPDTLRKWEQRYRILKPSRTSGGQRRYSERDVARVEWLRARLDQLAADPHGAVRGTAVLACAPGERHDLGLLMLAVLLGAEGWHVEYLGADMPVAQTLA